MWVEKVIADNLLWARPPIQIILGCSGCRSEVSPEPAAKDAFSLKQTTCHRAHLGVTYSGPLYLQPFRSKNAFLRVACKTLCEQVPPYHSALSFISPLLKLTPKTCFGWLFHLGGGSNRLRIKTQQLGVTITLHILAISYRFFFGLNLAQFSTT